MGCFGSYTGTDIFKTHIYLTYVHFTYKSYLKQIFNFTIFNTNTEKEGENIVIKMIFLFNMPNPLFFFLGKQILTDYKHWNVPFPSRELSSQINFLILDFF